MPNGAFISPRVGHPRHSSRRLMSFLEERVQWRKRMSRLWHQPFAYSWLGRHKKYTSENQQFEPKNWMKLVVWVDVSPFPKRLFSGSSRSFSGVVSKNVILGSICFGSFEKELLYKTELPGPAIMEVENGCIWKVSTIGGTHFWLLWLWEEG